MHRQMRDVAAIEFDLAGSARNRPVSMLKNVVLPAPFGPIRLCRPIRMHLEMHVRRDDQRAEALVQAAHRRGSASPGIDRRSALPKGAIRAGRGGMPARVSVQRVAAAAGAERRPWMPSGDSSANRIMIGAKISHQLSVIARQPVLSMMKAMAPHSGPRN